MRKIIQNLPKRNFHFLYKNQIKNCRANNTQLSSIILQGQTFQDNISVQLFNYLNKNQKLQNFSTFQSNQNSKEQLRINLIKASLLYINKYGWHEKAISSACNDLNISSASQNILLNGPYDIVCYLIESWRAQLDEDIRNHENFQKLEVSERLKYCIQTRLSYQITYINRWNEAMSLGAMPHNIQQTISQLWKLCDEIAQHIGDESNQVDWYLKRSMILKLYLSTEFYMLNDKSEMFKETWRFLDRRIEDINFLESNYNYVKQFASSSFYEIINLSKAFNGNSDKYENPFYKYASAFWENSYSEEKSAQEKKNNEANLEKKQQEQSGDDQSKENAHKDAGNNDQQQKL